MTLAEQYQEHAAAALTTCRPHIARIGARIVGILGDDDHVRGWHLSAARLRGTGHGDDKSLVGRNLPIVDDRAACAIDVSSDWPASGEWLEDVRLRTKSGELDQVAEIIGDPDLIPGAPRDIKDAAYASAATGWEWVEYHGQGHVTWCHIGIWRSKANDTSLGDELLGGWTSTGPKGDLMSALDENLDPQAAPGVTFRSAITELYLSRGGRGQIQRTLGELLAFKATEQLSDAALQAAVDELGAGGGNVDVAAILAGVNAAVDRVLPAVIAKVDDDLQRIGTALTTPE